MRQEVTSTKLIVFGIINLVNWVLLVVMFVQDSDSSWKQIFYLTLWSYWVNCAYFAITYFCDIMSKCCDNDYSGLESFMRDTYFRYSFPYSCTVVLGFWVMVLMGEDFHELSDEAIGIAFSVFLHGIELGFVFLDFYWWKHKQIKAYCKDVIWLTVFYIGYITLNYIAKYVLDHNAYGFQEQSDLRALIGASIIIYMVILNFYAFYQCLLERKNCNKEESEPSKAIEMSNQAAQKKEENCNPERSNFVAEVRVNNPARMQ